MTIHYGNDLTAGLTDMADRLVTADEARLARAWSRAVAALPEGWGIQLNSTALSPRAWQAISVDGDREDFTYENAYGDSPAAALEALALALEARQP